MCRKKENLKTFFSFSCNLYCGKNVTLLLPNVRNVRRTLGPNFEHLRTSQFSPKLNFEPPKHRKKNDQFTNTGQFIPRLPLTKIIPSLKENMFFYIIQKHLLHLVLSQLDPYCCMHDTFENNIMPLKTTVIGAWPKPSYLNIKDWFQSGQSKN